MEKIEKTDKKFWDKVKYRVPDLPGEEWRPIKNWEMYEVSNMGRVNRLALHISVGDIQLDNPIQVGQNHFITYMTFDSKEFHNIPNRLIDVDFDNNTITDIEFDEKGVTKRIDEYIAPNSSKHLYNSLKEN